MKNYQIKYGSLFFLIIFTIALVMAIIDPSIVGGDYTLQIALLALGITITFAIFNEITNSK